MLNPNRSTCASCHYYAGGPVGECHRYPTRMRTTSAHWCGEHVAAKAPEPPPAPIVERAPRPKKKEPVDA